MVAVAVVLVGFLVVADEGVADSVPSRFVANLGAVDADRVADPHLDPAGCAPGQGRLAGTLQAGDTRLASIQNEPNSPPSFDCRLINS